MRKSKILLKLRAGDVARICCLYSPINMVPSHAANAGYDGVWLENEHNTWDSRELQRMLAMHQLADLDCVVRPAILGKTQLYSLLDNGATGLLIPHVSNKEAARFLVDAVKFPPLGQRGLDGSGLDNNFYLQGTLHYPVEANRETLLAVQIETLEALDNVEEIAAVAGIDVLFIGPGDLALRLGCALSWNEPKMQAAQKRVARAAAKHGIHWGRPSGTAEDMAQIMAEGGRFIAHGSDFDSIAFSMQNRYRLNFEKALAAANRPGSEGSVGNSAPAGKAY